MRRIILVLSLAAVMVGALSVSAVGAFADPGSVPGHCKDTDHGTRICAGGSGDSDGGGGGQIEFIPGFPPEELSSTTGGGSNFRGSGSGGGGKDCVVFGTDFGCAHGKTADHPPES